MNTSTTPNEYTQTPNIINTTYIDFYHKLTGWFHLKMNTTTYQPIQDEYYSLLISSLSPTNIPTKNTYELVSSLYFIRNQWIGHGERKLYYHLLLVWEKVFEFMDIHTLDKWNINRHKHLYTNELDTFKLYFSSLLKPMCWKDVKYILNFYDFKTITNTNHHVIPHLLMQHVKDQFIQDWTNYQQRQIYRFKQVTHTSNTNQPHIYSLYPISLLCKWLPRETSNKYGYQSFYIAYHLMQSLHKSSSTITYYDYLSYSLTKKASIMKQYRKILAGLNKEVNTLEIKLSSNEPKWRDIDFEKQYTSSNLLKYHNSFMRQQSPSQSNGMDDVSISIKQTDRQLCREKYLNYIVHPLNELRVEHITLHQLMNKIMNTIIHKQELQQQQKQPILTYPNTIPSPIVKSSYSLSDTSILNILWKHMKKKIKKNIINIQSKAYPYMNQPLFEQSTMYHIPILHIHFDEMEPIMPPFTSYTSYMYEMIGNAIYCCQTYAIQKRILLVLSLQNGSISYDPIWINFDTNHNTNTECIYKDVELVHNSIQEGLKTPVYNKFSFADTLFYKTCTNQFITTHMEYHPAVYKGMEWVCFKLLENEPHQYNKYKDVLQEIRWVIFSNGSTKIHHQNQNQNQS
jgi:hypothetical protein